HVLPLPGAPAAGDPPAVAQGLTLDLRLDPPNGRVGEPIAVTATLAGVGNVALWPEPAIAWPPGFRSYPGETGTRIEARQGRVAGAKTFHYLVMPDSAGSFQLPALRYSYYDVASGDAATATLAPRALMVAAGLEPRAPRALPPLERGRGPVWTDELAHDLVPWGWLVLFVGPPLLAWLWRRRRPTAPIRVAAPAPAPLSRIGRAGRRGRDGRVVAAVVLGAAACGSLGAVPRPAAAQALGAEALYEAGALRAAADSFAARAAAQPRVPAHWYNLGATLYRAGAD